MNWGGLSSGGLGNHGIAGWGSYSAAASPYRGGMGGDGGSGSSFGAFSAGYGRGGLGGDFGGTSGFSGFGGGFGNASPYSRLGAGLDASAGAGLSSSAVADMGSETPRVALIGIGGAARACWGPLHASGLRVTVVVGTDDMRSGPLSGSSEATRSLSRLPVTDAQRGSSAEAARAFTERCIRYCRLPRRSHVASASPSGSEADLVGVRTVVCDDTEATSGSPDAPPSPSKASSTLAAAGTASPHLQPTAASRAKRDEDVIATSWSWFFNELDTSKAGAADDEAKPNNTSCHSGSSLPSAALGGSYWSARPGMSSAASSPAGTASIAAPLMDNIEIAYVASTGPDDDELGLCAALLWLLQREKHVVVDVPLSAHTVAMCAAAGAGTVRGKAEVKRLFLYRGGGCRRGWPEAAMVPLRTVVGIRGVKGAARMGSGEGVSTPSASSVKPSAFVKAAAPPAASNEGSFSIFDLMGSDLSTALKDAEGQGEGDSGRTAPAGKSNTASPAPSAGASPSGAVTTASLSTTAPPGSTGEVNEGAQITKPVKPAPTSIALDSLDSKIGTMRRISVVVVGPHPPRRECSRAFGVMASFGWDAVASALHLLSWICPDMVVGRVVRRAPATREPLCVQAELYYGIEAPAADASAATPDRPAYLTVSLHIAAQGGGRSTSADDGEATEDGDGPNVFQQRMCIIGTSGVLTVDQPLLPILPVTTAEVAPQLSTTTPPKGEATSTALHLDKTPFTVKGTASVALPMAPMIAYTYRLATQDVEPTTGQRERREMHFTATAAEPCAEFRLWRHVRAQLRVQATAAGALSMGGGSYGLHGTRYADRGGGGRGLGGGYYSRGLGVRGRGTGFGGMGHGATASAAVSQPKIMAEVLKPERAAQDIQRAWLVQAVIEKIFESAASSS